MKFFHVADVHLGAEPDKGYPWSRDRGREIWESFQNVIQQAGRENAGLFLIAGDLFHRQPLLKDLKAVNALFASVPDMKIVIIAGNHDYIRDDSVRKKLKWAGNVYWLDQEELSYIDFPELDTRVYGFSYHSREIQMPLYDKVKADTARGFRILLAHGGDEKHIPISSNTFAGTDFDYVALGHIHKPQVLEENRIAYAGSLEPLDKNETGAHGYIKGEYDRRGVRITFVPFAQREYKRIKIQVKEKTTQFSLESTIKRTLEEKGMENIYTIQLEGNRAIDTEFFLDSLCKAGNIREIEDRTRIACTAESMKKKYQGSILEAFIELMEQEKETRETEKILNYGIEALLESVEETL